MPSTVPRARVAPAPQRTRHAIVHGTPATSNFDGHARARASPVVARRRPISCDSSRATRLPPSLYADYILRLQDTEPESFQIMLRLLLVALPLVVASPAAFDAQEIDALQIEVQVPLQIEVRSPPESRPLRPAATRDQHDSPALHSTPHARHPPTANITMDALRH